MPRGRGGKRTPAQPAAVSGPGALSRRTDGGAGSETQPIRSHPAEFHGQRQQLAQQQQAAPMAAKPHPLAGNLFGGTERPGEPVTAGASMGPGPGPQQPMNRSRDILLAAYRIAPSESLRRLIERSGHGV